MKYIKLFESFTYDNLSENLSEKFNFWKRALEPEEIKLTLVQICCMYKDENLGFSHNYSDTWGDGTWLKEVAEETNDSKIKSISDNMIKLSKGQGKSLSDYLKDEDCDYIAKFFGIAPLNYEEDWTKEEEDTWDRSKCENRFSEEWD